MQETYITQAIVLNRYPMRENDSRVILYTKERGKIDLVARGTRKTSSKLAAHLEPLNLSQVMIVRGRQYDYVGSIESEKCYRNIKEDLNSLVYAGSALKFFNRLIKGEQKDAVLFMLLKEFLDIMEEASSVKASEYLKNVCYHLFLLKLISELGYKPELYHCLLCKQKIEPTSIYFNIPSGGLICGNCIDKAVQKNENMAITKDCIKVMRLAIEKELKNIVKIKMNANLSNEIILITGSFAKYCINN